MRITVGLPFFNAEATLVDAIRSVFAQTEPDWELVLVDDGSTDASLEIARAIEDPRVRVQSDGERKGLPYRLNQIAKNARAPLLARMDADDLMHPERLQRQICFLEAHPDIDIVGSWAYTIDGDGAIRGLRGIDPLDQDLKAILRSGGLLIHPSIMGRTEWFLRNPYDESLSRAQDFELWCRTCRTSRFAKIREPLLFYREDVGRSPSVNRRNRRLERRIIRGLPREALRPVDRVLFLGRSLMKEWLFSIGALTGSQRLILRGRSRPLQNAEQWTQGAEALSRVEETPVPGLSRPIESAK